MRREKEEVGNFPASISCAGFSECDVIIALFNYSSTLQAEGRGIMERPVSSLIFPFFRLSFTFSFLSVCVSKNLFQLPFHLVLNPINVGRVYAFLLPSLCSLPSTLAPWSGTDSQDQVTYLIQCCSRLHRHD